MNTKRNETGLQKREDKNGVKHHSNSDPHPPRSASTNLPPLPNTSSPNLSKTPSGPAPLLPHGSLLPRTPPQTPSPRHVAKHKIAAAGPDSPHPRNDTTAPPPSPESPAQPHNRPRILHRRPPLHQPMLTPPTAAAPPACNTATTSPAAGTSTSSNPKSNRGPLSHSTPKSPPPRIDNNAPPPPRPTPTQEHPRLRIPHHQNLRPLTLAHPQILPPLSRPPLPFSRPARRAAEQNPLSLRRLPGDFNHRVFPRATTSPSPPPRPTAPNARRLRRRGATCHQHRKTTRQSPTTPGAPHGNAVVCYPIATTTVYSIISHYHHDIRHCGFPPAIQRIPHTRLCCPRSLPANIPQSTIASPALSVHRNRARTLQTFKNFALQLNVSRPRRHSIKLR